MIEVDLTGKAMERKLLPKNQSIARFSICKDEKGTDQYLFVRQEGKEVAILDIEGKILFRQKFQTNYERTVQFFHFNLEVNLVVITDKAAAKTYVYFTSGDPLIGSPFDSEQAVSIHYNKSRQAYYLNKCYGKSIEAIKLEVR